MSTWAFSLLSYDAYDSDGGEDYASTAPVSDDSKLMNDFDLSSRPENVVYKPNPLEYFQNKRRM